MFNLRQSQMNNIMPASIPGGPNTIPLNDQAQQQSGVSTPSDDDDYGKRAMDLVQKIARGNIPPDEMLSWSNFIKEGLEKSHQFSTPGLDQLWAKLYNSVTVNSNTDTYTEGLVDPPQQVAKEILNMKQVLSSDNVFNLRTSARTEEKPKAQPIAEEDKTKKKTRGNPFRVLMGQVGKLLDHGMEKRDIVQYVHKKMKGFDESIISKAIDIVKDYNKKKRRKPQKEANAFNLNTFTKTASFFRDEENDLYTVTPEWTKRSTAELMARASWLKSLMLYDDDVPMLDQRKADDKKGASSQLTTIRGALKERGFNENEIP